MLLLYRDLLLKVLPLFVYAVLGYVIGRSTKISQRTFATLLFYYVTPLVLFFGSWRAELSASLLVLPATVFAISCGMCLWTLRRSRKRFPDGASNLLAYTAGTANSGYFGLPIAIALFPPQGVATYIFALMGMTLYESSLGFFVAALGRSSVKEALLRVLGLPTLWAFLLGIGLCAAELPIPRLIAPIELSIQFCYSCLGMMVIGIGLARMERFSLDWGFVRASFTVRFILWPIAVGALYAVDHFLLGHFFTQDAYRALLLASFVPLAANTVVVASLCDIHPEKAAGAVALSLGVGFFLVPLVASIFF